MASENKVEEWEARLQRWRASGLTAQVFAAKEGIGSSTLALWARKLAAQKKGLEGVGLARVETRKPAVVRADLRTALAVEVGGVVIRVDEGTDLDFLALVVDALGKKA